MGKTMLFKPWIFLSVVFSFVEGNNFPPVENPVPIPGRAVKAPLEPGPGRVYFGNAEAGAPNYVGILQGQAFDPRWYGNQFMGYFQHLQSGKFPQKEEAFEENGELDESGIQSVGPVATPPPDEFSDSGVNFSPKFPQVPIVQTPNGFRFTVGEPANKYTVQRWIAVDQQRPIKSAVPPPPLQASAYRYIPQAPELGFGNQVWINSNKVYPSVQALIQNLPIPQKIKGPPPPLPAHVQKSSVSLPYEKGEGKSVVLENKGIAVASQVPALPKVFPAIQAVNQSPPFLPSAVNKNDLRIQPITGWVADTEKYLSQMRPVFLPNAPQVGKTIVPASTTIKNPTADESISPIGVPAGFAVADAWVLRQDSKMPYLESVRTLLPNFAEYSPKGVPAIAAVRQRANSVAMLPVPPKSIEPSFAPLVFRRGSKDGRQLIGAAVVDALPHSPKSDVLVIGKGRTLAHLAPQKNGLLQPPQTLPSKPCLASNVQQFYPYSPKTSGVISSGLPAKHLPFSTKGNSNHPAMNMRTPYTYYIWNPSATQQRLLERPILSPKAIPMNRMQQTLRYFNPFGQTMLNIGRGKPISPNDVRFRIPPPIPAARSPSKDSSSESSEERGSSRREKEETSSQEETLSKSNPEEAESAHAGTVKQTPELDASYTGPTTSNGDNKPPEENGYSYGYPEGEDTTSTQNAPESSNVIKDTYSYDPTTIFREIGYVTSNEGFQTVVSEPDTLTYEGTNINEVSDTQATTSAKDLQNSTDNFYAGASTRRLE